MASSSKLSVQRSFKYDVFLSFRGEDTRKNFVDHLYHALKDKGIYTYKDDEKIQKGKRISDDLIKSIEDSKFYIIVFSKNYASSSWCLEELVKIMESHKMTGHTAYPVFYDVEPTEVRKQSGAVGEAFAKHENEEAAEKWKGALREAADLAGWELKNTNDGHEAKFIKKVVQEISLELRSINSSFDEKLVGMQTRVKDVVSSLEIGTNEVRMVGIKGMGGAGKTTTVRAVYDHLSNHFEAKRLLMRCEGKYQMARCMPLEVRNPLQDMKRCHQKSCMLLACCLPLTVKYWVHFSVSKRLGETKEDAIRILESRGFHARIGLKVLEQRSLITVSSKYIFNLCKPEEVLGMHDHIEEMGKNIVRREHPDEPNKHSRLWITKEIKDILANDMGTEATRCLKLKTARGNPRIAMKGLGKMKKLQYLELDLAVCNFKMKKLHCLGLKISYINSSLPNSLKYLKCRDYPFLNLPKILQANNLVGLDMDSRTRMVQLRKKGEKKVLKKLKFLSLHGSKLTTYDFRITPNLDTLYLNGSYNLKELCMPTSCQKLTCLHISGSRIRTFDLGLTPNMERLSLRNSPNLVELFMPVSCQKLKHLDIYDSKLRTFHLGLTPNLETLSLDYCDDLEELHVCVACPNLKSLNLRKSRLRSLDLELIPNLERLDLYNCADFVELQVSAPRTNLKFLKLCNLRLRSLDLELIPNLEMLYLYNCNKLVEINAPVGCLKKVGYLNLSGCLRFTDFVFHGRSEPNVSHSSAKLDLDGESLDLCPLHPNSNLPKLRFRCSYAEDLPSSVGNIEKLTSFGLCACTDLKKFSDLICSLQCLQKLTLRGDIPEYLGELECLKSLTVSDGDLIEKLPDDLGRLECLEELCFHSSEIKHLPDSICMLKRLKSLTVNNGYYFEDLFEKLPEDLGQLECLEELYVSSKKIEYLPDSICMLKRLKSLNFSGCCCLGKLPEDIGRLESLESLDLWGTAIKHLPDSVCLLKHLKLLDVAHCWCLGKLPKYIGHLESLERLDVSSTEITHLPDSICILKHLNYLNLENCPLLEELPEDLGRLECLEEIWPRTSITRMELSSELL
ncbi:TMV resistance protein N-like protein [Tanacetum coccineum]|uniref:TMV resistance protein N-like protein n=1 Tax=Tanacetum coccineum TaxID=301880 RepID=A0ABQ5BKI3_9ASTR